MTLMLSEVDEVMFMPALRIGEGSFTNLKYWWRVPFTKEKRSYTHADIPYMCQVSSEQQDSQILSITLRTCN